MKIAIIGGGIAGMSLGYYLTKADHCVMIYEKEDETGGLAGTFSLETDFIEKYYHHIFLTDVYTIKLIEELGLKEKIGWHESRMGMYCEGRVYPFGTPFDLLKFRPLSFVDKIRFALSTLYLVRTEDYNKLETVTVEEFLLKTAGPNVYRKIWEPLLVAKFGNENYKHTTASWFHARVGSRGRSKKSIFEREKLGYLDGSLKVLFDELERRIRGGSGAVKKGAAVKRIDLDSDKKVIVSADRADNSARFDACCLCVPNPAIVDIAGHLFSREYISAYLDSIKYRGILCVVLIIKGALSPYYWINISEEKVPFTALVEHANLISKDRYSGNNIIYLGRYISSDEAQYNMKDSDLIDLYSGHIKDIFPDFDKSIIRRSFVFRDAFAEPIYTKGYKERIPPITTPVKNIFINNISQAYPEIRGVSPLIRKSFESFKIINTVK